MYPESVCRSGLFPGSVLASPSSFDVLGGLLVRLLSLVVAFLCACVAAALLFDRLAILMNMAKACLLNLREQAIGF